MSHYRATIRWEKRSGDEFLRREYSREHVWQFDGGLSVSASSSPSVVPVPWSNPAGVDPEEAFVASVASCHMLTFLWLAATAGFVVEKYLDEASGEMGKNETGASWISTVRLRPSIEWGGKGAPTPAELQTLHHEAHEQCFIANSVKTTVLIDTLAPDKRGV
jgi:organic hydroperoxide reductase OsmC/OhrA